MSVICIITGVLELLVLVTLTGVLVTFAALLSLLELTLMSINPVCLYLVRQSGQLLTCSIVLMVHQAQHVTHKMCPSSFHESNQNSIVATIEPLPTDMDIDLLSPLVLEVPPNNNVLDLTQNSRENSDNGVHIEDP